jgi:hypothetical protein
MSNNRMGCFPPGTPEKDDIKRRIDEAAKRSGAGHSRRFRQSRKVRPRKEFIAP